MQAVEGIGDPSSFSDGGYVAIAQLCAQRGAHELGRLIPAGERFWVRHEALSTAGLESSIDALTARRGADKTDIAAPVRGRWSFVASAVALAAVELVCPGDEVVDDVISMVNDLAVAFEIWEELSTIQRDLVDGRTTYPIAVVARHGGIPLQPTPRPIEVLGALVATGALRSILDTASERLAASQRAAAELTLPILGSYLEAVARADSQRRTRLSGVHGPGHARQKPVVSVAAEDPTSAKATAMAEAFLLSDLTFRESWETHREGMLGAPEVSSRFPAGLILEILCRRGLKLDGAVGVFLSHAASNRFRYYDHPGSDVDADTVGVVLRLQKYGPARDRISPAMARMLGCIDRLAEASAEIPVWLTECNEPKEPRPATFRLGERCGTVVGHLLIGLTEIRGSRATVETGAVALLDRVANVGLGANINYPPRYALAVFFRLLECLSARRLSESMSVRLTAARTVLVGELERRSSAPVTSAQEAALAVLAAHAGGRKDLVRPGWITTILKQQRFDGSWPTAPFAVAPNRGWRVSAYSSTTLTTALCYDALSTAADGSRERLDAWSLIGPWH